MDSPSRAVSGARAGLGLLGLAGAVLLVVSTFTTVVQIRVLTATEVVGQDLAVSGRDLHGLALVVVAVLAAVMLLGAVRGARPAMVALAAMGLVALGVIVSVDVPELDSTGSAAEFYEDVSAGAATGFYIETLGAVLLLLAGGLLLLLSLPRVDARLSRVAAAAAGAGAGLKDLGGAGSKRARAGAARAGRGKHARAGRGGDGRADRDRDERSSRDRSPRANPGGQAAPGPADAPAPAKADG